ncbi:MAG: FHA domain-containing protein [Myxococcota bacterium]
MHKVLVIQGDADAEVRQRIGLAPVTVGRGPRNTLILADATVSWHHAVVWSEAGELRVRDLRSSNGTFVNDERIETERAVADGDRLRFGSVSATVEPAPDAAASPRRSFCLQDEQGHVSYALTRDRFHVGPGPEADLEASEAAMLLVLVDEVRLVRDDLDEPLAVGDTFEVDGRTLRLVEQPVERTPTVSEQPAGFPYRLEVALDGPLGPRAVLTHLQTGARFQVDSGNRAILLWFLARRFQEHEAAAEDRGWCGDGEVQTALWGRAGDVNKLDVLLHRLRTDLRKAGFDPWFVEKRNRHLRARVAEVRVLDE